MDSTEARPKTTEAAARGFPAAGRLLLLVWAANSSGRCGASDHSGDGDQGNEIWERGEEVPVVGPGVHVRELRRQGVHEPEQERGAEDAGRPPVAEDQGGQGDEAAPGRLLLGEGVVEAD